MLAHVALVKADQRRQLRRRGAPELGNEGEQLWGGCGESLRPGWSQLPLPEGAADPGGALPTIWHLVVLQGGGQTSYRTLAGLAPDLNVCSPTSTSSGCCSSRSSSVTSACLPSHSTARFALPRQLRRRGRRRRSAGRRAVGCVRDQARRRVGRRGGRPLAAVPRSVDTRKSGEPIVLGVIAGTGFVLRAPGRHRRHPGRCARSVTVRALRSFSTARRRSVASRPLRRLSSNSPASNASGSNGRPSHSRRSSCSGCGSGRRGSRAAPGSPTCRRSPRAGRLAARRCTREPRCRPSREAPSRR